MSGSDARGTLVRLVDVYEAHEAVDMLWDLLAERPANACINHRHMPTRAEHEAFVASRPYAAWYLIDVGGDQVGAVYLTNSGEIGIAILRAAQRRGYATAAVRALMERHPRQRFLANINLDNPASLAMFGRLGFTHIQNTYERSDECPPR